MPRNFTLLVPALTLLSATPPRQIELPARFQTISAKANIALTTRCLQRQTLFLSEAINQRKWIFHRVFLPCRVLMEKSERKFAAMTVLPGATTRIQVARYALYSEPCFTYRTACGRNAQGSADVPTLFHSSPLPRNHVAQGYGSPSLNTVYSVSFEHKPQAIRS